MPDFTPSKTIEWQFAVDETTLYSKYNMILGRDIQQALGMDILWSTGHLRWDGIQIPMYNTSSIDQEPFTNLLEPEDELFHAATEPTKILEAKYEKADINATVEALTHLSKEQKQQLKALLFKFEHLFDGTLGLWDTAPVDLELKTEAKPFHLPYFPVPHIHLETLKKEIARLCAIKVLRQVATSEYASPSFIIPKKNGTVRVVSDFRMLNSLLKWKPYPIPKIQDLLATLNGFTFATSLGLNMVYYTIRLTPDALHKCTIIFSWGKYKYLRLPMGIANSPDSF